MIDSLKLEKKEKKRSEISTTLQSTTLAIIYLSTNYLTLLICMHLIVNIFTFLNTFLIDIFPRRNLLFFWEVKNPETNLNIGLKTFSYLRALFPIYIRIFYLWSVSIKNLKDLSHNQTFIQTTQHNFQKFNTTGYEPHVVKKEVIAMMNEVMYSHQISRIWLFKIRKFRKNGNFMIMLPRKGIFFLWETMNRSRKGKNAF